MFTKDPFNIAPQAPQHTLTARLAMMAAASLVAWGGWQLAMSLQAWEHAAGIRAAHADAQHAAQRRAGLAADASPAAQDKRRVVQELHDARSMDWPAFFDALEASGLLLRGETSIITLSPVRQDAGTQEFAVAAVASSRQGATLFLNALGAQHGVRQVHLVSLQPLEAAVSDAVRFRFSILWNRARPDAATGASAPSVSPVEGVR